MLGDLADNCGGISRIDIPVPQTDDPFPIGPDPKLWNGAWNGITDPILIAQHICAANIRQYNQAYNTPFGSGPLANQIGLKAESQAACALLQGTNPPLPPSTLSKTSQILEALSRPLSLTPQIISASISLDQFISTYKAAQEITSSSFSGRHVGRTKAILEDTSLCKLHSSMMSIPYMTGFSSSR
jgi:hypothetical protein